MARHYETFRLQRAVLNVLDTHCPVDIKWVDLDMPSGRHRVTVTVDHLVEDRSWVSNLNHALSLLGWEYVQTVEHGFVTMLVYRLK